MSEGREELILDTLRRLSEQRVVGILQPGNVLVVEKAPTHNDDTIAALKTCHLRGWVEVVHDAVPRATIGDDGSLPSGWESAQPVYRLTEAGWHVIRGTHGWVVGTFFVALAAAVFAFVSLFL